MVSNKFYKTQGVSRFMRKFDSGIWQKSITGGVLLRPLGYFRAVGAQRVRAAAAAWLALDASRADCHSPDQQVLLDDLKVLHIHVFLAAPLSTCHMAEPRADQHQGGISIRECSHHAGSAVDLAVQPLDHVVGTDARRSRSASPQCRPRPSWQLQLHCSQHGDHGLRLLAGRFLLS